MPTPSGKPKSGEVLVHHPTGHRMEVLHRYPGALAYSCKVRHLTGPDAGREKVVTEVDYWLDHGWTIEPPPAPETATEGPIRAEQWVAVVKGVAVSTPKRTNGPVHPDGVLVNTVVNFSSPDGAVSGLIAIVGLPTNAVTGERVTITFGGEL